MEARLSWDWNANPDNLVDEFCNGLFGPDAGPYMRAFFYAVEEKRPFEEREELLELAKQVLSARPDSPEAKCVHLFELGERMWSASARMQDAERRQDWARALAFCREGLAAYHELSEYFPDLYRHGGDFFGAPHLLLEQMEPIYFDALQFRLPDVPIPTRGKGFCLTDNLDLPPTQRLSTGVEAHYSIPPDNPPDGPPSAGRRLFNGDLDGGWNDMVGLSGGVRWIGQPVEWSITLDFEDVYEFTQVELTVGTGNPAIPVFIDVAVSEDNRSFKIVDRIYPGGRRREWLASRLFSVRGRYVRLFLQGKADGQGFDVGEVRVWGYPVK